MCLVKTHWIPKISKEPITCYKLINTFWKHSACTPYLGASIPENGLLKGKYPFWKELFKKNIGGWGVHAFLDTNVKPHRYLKLVRCTIPKHTFYFIGDNGDICARKMIVHYNILYL